MEFNLRVLLFTIHLMFYSILNVSFTIIFQPTKIHFAWWVLIATIRLCMHSRSNLQRPKKKPCGWKIYARRKKIWQVKVFHQPETFLQMKNICFEVWVHEIHSCRLIVDRHYTRVPEQNDCWLVWYFCATPVKNSKDYCRRFGHIIAKKSHFAQIKKLILE